MNKLYAWMFVAGAVLFLLEPSVVHSDQNVQVSSIVITDATGTPPVAPSLVESMYSVCSCESTGTKDGPPQQFNPDGSVLRGKVNPNDIGMCQINVEPRNGNIQAAERMGFDVYTESGNILMANWLYAHQGLTPWNNSRACWGS